MAVQKKDAIKLERGEAAFKNFRCRVCRVVDGYAVDENKCRFCGSRLFKGDVV